MSDKINKEETNEKTQEVVNVEIATNLNISEDVIGIIAGLAASEVEGIAGMSLGFVDGINQILGTNKKYSKGVKIDLDGRKVTIDLYVNITYGVRIPDIAWAAQNAVKVAVENMTGLEVSAVNINVQGITFDKESTKE
ncbi:MAG: Asp23/Gls24 family envelope stress response protein [Clostridia bacterium]